MKEPALLMAKHERNEGGELTINEGKVMPKLLTVYNEKEGDSELWYLDNCASNHMTGQKSKFSTLDSKVTGQVRFGDRSIVNIEGKRLITL